MAPKCDPATDVCLQPPIFDLSNFDSDPRDQRLQSHPSAAVRRDYYKVMATSPRWDPNEYNSAGCTPLLDVLLHTMGYRTFALLLENPSTDINKGSNPFGMTPLMVAACHPEDGYLKMLLNNPKGLPDIYRLSYTSSGSLLNVFEHMKFTHYVSLETVNQRRSTLMEKYNMTVFWP